MLRRAKTLMNLLKEKLRNLLILAVVTIVLLLALWIMVRRPVQADITKKENTIHKLNQKIAEKKNVILQGDQVANELQSRTALLKAAEEQMVNGDPYLWILRVLRDFEIPDQ